MKKSILRLLATTLILTFIIGAIVACIGWLLRWHSTTQFSNAMFWPGAILIVLGLLSVTGGYGMRSNFGVLYSQSAGDMNLRERTQRWVSDMTQGYSTFILLCLTGAFLIGLAVLIGTIF
jgi:hypothetical protein